MVALGTWRKLLQVAVFTSTISMLTVFQQLSSSSSPSIDYATTKHKDDSFVQSFADPEFKPTRSIHSKNTYNNGSRNIPKFDDGGILIFYHLYKTGGSTVRQLMANQAWDMSDDDDDGDTTFFFATLRKEIDWSFCSSALRKAKRDKTRVMYELHIEYPAPKYPTLVQLVPWLDACREAAQAEGIPFFAFTVLREPVAHAISFFNFWNIAIKHKTEWNPFSARMEPTEENFLKTFQGNRQCHFLDADPEGVVKAPLAALKIPTDKNLLRMRAKLNGESDESELFKKCRITRVREALFEKLDWVGTTQDLQNTTLPLISSILLNDPEVGRAQQREKVFDEDEKYKKFTGLKVQDLSEAALARVKYETRWDMQLYEEALARYQYP